MKLLHLFLIFLGFVPLPIYSLDSLTESHRNESLLLIIGCGRSGTGYIANLLTVCGLEIGHEFNHADGISSWYLVGESDSPVGKTEYKHIFHQVRHPLDVISFWYNNVIQEPFIWEYKIYPYIPQINPEDLFLVKCAKYWYYWNLKAEKKAHWRYKIEDIDSLFEEFDQRLELKLNWNYSDLAEKNFNSWKKGRRISWSDLKMVLTEDDFSNLQNLSLRYGYPID